MRALILVVFLGLTFSLPARADDPAPEKKLREEALRLMEEGRVADARDIHLSLWRLHGRPIDAFNTGTLSYSVHDWIKAAEYLNLWLDRVPPPAPSAPERERRKRERARTDLEQARRHVGALVVSVSEPGAEVLVDGAAAGRSPLPYPVFVTPGEHRLRAKRDGAESEEITVKAEAGVEQTVRLELHGKPAPAAVPAPAQQKPAEKKKGEVVPPPPEPPPATRPPVISSRGATLMAGGAALVGSTLLLTAVGFHWRAGDQADALRVKAGRGGCLEAKNRAACEDLQDTIKVRDMLFGGGAVSWAASLGIASGMVISNLLSPAKPDRQGVRVLPAVGSAGVGVKAVW